MRLRDYEGGSVADSASKKRASSVRPLITNSEISPFGSLLSSSIRMYEPLQAALNSYRLRRFRWRPAKREFWYLPTPTVDRILRTIAAAQRLASLAVSP
jgi:hypothetical protein